MIQAAKADILKFAKGLISELYEVDIVYQIDLVKQDGMTLDHYKEVFKDVNDPCIDVNAYGALAIPTDNEFGAFSEKSAYDTFANGDKASQTEDFSPIGTGNVIWLPDYGFGIWS